MAISAEQGFAREDAGGRRRFARMSDRERIVLTRLAQGMSTDEIALALHVSPHTVRTHIKNGMRKLNARTRAHAVAIAICDGVISV
jgi:DNA-binding CsgD family transcriptional regulator